MSELSFFSTKLNGNITLPPYKSEAIRILIMSALSGVSPTAVVCLPDKLGNDLIAAKRAAESLHALISHERNEPIYVNESASLLRLLIPISLAYSDKCEFIISIRLWQRGLDEYVRALNCSLSFNQLSKTHGILTVTGIIKPMRYSVDVSRSSQFASGMLMMLPLVKGAALSLPYVNGNIELVSKPYFDLTLELMKRFGIQFEADHLKDSVVLSASGKYSFPGNISLSGDGSYAANYIVANSFGSDVKFSNYPDFMQSDTVIDSIIHHDVIDISDCPDLFPILCIAACGRNGLTVIKNTARLSTKESDRVFSMQAGIASLGGNICVAENSVRIFGNGHLSCGTVNSFNDHRIVMAFAIASLIADGPIRIINADAVAKSAPSFFDDFVSLGGVIIED